ncbi:MAG: asparaginase [Flavobacteriales bacterium]
MTFILKKREKSADILLIYTGGTIGMVSDCRTQTLRAFNFDRLLDQVGEIHQLDCCIDLQSFVEPIDSSDISPNHWIQLAEIIEKNYHQYDGFVVLHGSDTMAYSASVLSFMLENLSKPVIFTGSQLPIGAIRTDAKENLITAIQLAAMREGGAPLIQEVGLYFANKLLRANRSTKINTAYFEAFASLHFPPLVEAGIHLEVNRSALLRNRKALVVNKELDTRIALVKFFPGINPTFLEPIFVDTAVKGVLLETYGSGNATTEKWFLKLLKKGLDRGLKIVNVSQCIGGSVELGRYETSRYMKALGIVSGCDMTTESALAKMMLLLPRCDSVAAFKKEFERSMVGELSLN